MNFAVVAVCVPSTITDTLSLMHYSTKNCRPYVKEDITLKHCFSLMFIWV
jgi:hypothetical protein